MTSWWLNNIFPFLALTTIGPSRLASKFSPISLPADQSLHAGIFDNQYFRLRGVGPVPHGVFGIAAPDCLPFWFGQGEPLGQVPHVEQLPHRPDVVSGREKPVARHRGFPCAWWLRSCPPLLPDPVAQVVRDEGHESL